MTDSHATGPPAPATLNPNHVRRIASTFTYVDGLLREVERLARLEPGPFAREQADVGPTEARLLLALVETARGRMLLMLEHLGLPRPKANLSARWSIVTALRFIDIALSDLTEGTLRGYGTIDTGSASEVAAASAELRGVIDRGRDLLQPQEAARLQARLATVSGPLGEVLRRAEEISTAHGIVEVRALIGAAADRAEANTIDVGIFGRVSSGKSSLVNAVIGVAVLPVGATPVTAVPLRVTNGPDEIRVCFANEHDQAIEPARLAEFATEANNPDNVRNVRSILIHTPLLAEGLALLDTPGVGSMSQSGPAQAFAWLPRCDLGVVLVPAGTPLGRDELALVNGLTQAGIPVEVLLSKSDLLSTSDREAALEYLRRELGRNADTSRVTVRPVSVAASARELFLSWWQEELIPMIADRRSIAAESFAGRVRAIISALDAALQHRSEGREASLDLQRVRLEAQGDIESTSNDLEGAGAGASQRAAAAISSAWRAGNDGRDAARRALIETATVALGRARAAADRVLEASGRDGAADAGHRIPPLFDPPLLDSLPVPPRPSVFDRMSPQSTARRRLAPIKKPLDDAYSTFSLRLRAWALQRLEENMEQVTALRTDGAELHAPELRALTELADTYFAANHR